MIVQVKRTEDVETRMVHLIVCVTTVIVKMMMECVLVSMDNEG